MLLSFHGLSTAPVVRNTSEGQRFNSFPFQQGFRPRPGKSAYQQPAGPGDGVEVVYCPPSDAQQFSSKGTVLKQSHILAGIVGSPKQACSGPPCHMAGAIIPFSIPCPLCHVDDTLPTSVLVPTAVKGAGFACFPLLHSPVEAQDSPWGFSSSPSLLSAMPPLQSWPRSLLALSPPRLLLGEGASRWCSKTPNLVLLPHVPGQGYLGTSTPCTRSAQIFPTLGTAL